MYSQNNEDEIISRYFGDFKGTLLDAGANDGVTFSNSLYLVEKGWAAHLFEPSHIYHNLVLLHLGRDNVRVYNKGIGAETKKATLYESGAHVPGGTDQCLVSTCVEQEMDRWANVSFRPADIDIVSFKDWHEQAGLPRLDFITIDCEGMDWEVLQQIHLQASGCRCLCIEWNSKPELGKLYTEYCNSYGLYEIHRNAENIIYAL